MCYSVYVVHEIIHPEFAIANEIIIQSIIRRCVKNVKSSRNAVNIMKEKYLSFFGLIARGYRIPEV